MQQFCLYGSVRGVPGNQHPYRDKMGSGRQFCVTVQGVGKGDCRNLEESSL